MNAGCCRAAEHLRANCRTPCAGVWSASRGPAAQRLPCRAGRTTSPAHLRRQGDWCWAWHGMPPARSECAPCSVRAVCWLCRLRCCCRFLTTHPLVQGSPQSLHGLELPALQALKAGCGSEGRVGPLWHVAVEPRIAIGRANLQTPLVRRSVFLLVSVNCRGPSCVAACAAAEGAPAAARGTCRKPWRSTMRRHRLWSIFSRDAQ